MKNLKQALKRKPDVEKKSTRITNETIAEHRERILAGGRRFKYPVQYTKNKLAINAIILGIIVVVLAMFFCWWQLYKVQSTADFFYRLTRLIPIPVASVQDEKVRYGDYLLNYRTSEVYLNTVEKNTGTASNSDSKYNYYKVQAMNNAIADAYARKLAREHNVIIEDKEVDAAINLSRQTASKQGEVSESVYNRSVERLYGISPSELRYYLKERLLRQAVEYTIDEKAKEASETVQAALKKDPNVAFDKLVLGLNKKMPTKAQVLVSGWVSKDNKDGGIATAASKLKAGKFVGPIKPTSGDGYYFVKLLEANDEGEINYQLIKIPLTEFNSQLETLKNTNKIDYYITLPDA
jgi:hypothetical protein